MGNTWKVYGWQNVAGDYEYVLRYAGENWIAAIRAAWKAKREGCGCVKIEWRGN